MRVLVDHRLSAALARWPRIGKSTEDELFNWIEPPLPMVVRQTEREERRVEVRRTHASSALDWGFR